MKIEISVEPKRAPLLQNYFSQVIYAMALKVSSLLQYRRLIESSFSINFERFMNAQLFNATQEIKFFFRKKNLIFLWVNES